MSESLVYTDGPGRFAGNLFRGVVSSMYFRAVSILLMSLAVSAMSIPQAPAQNLIDRRQHGAERNANGGVSLDRAVRMAETRYGAKAIKATTVSNGDRRIHQIRLIREGKVWTVSVDAETGDMS